MRPDFLAESAREQIGVSSTLLVRVEDVISPQFGAALVLE
jgi:hypothetical protein